MNWLKTSNIIIVSILLNLLFITGIWVLFNRIGTLKDDNKATTELYSALTDSLRIYKDKNGDLVIQKNTIQADLSSLSDIYDKLNKNQKDLLEYVESLEKENNVISAALYDMEFRYDSILNQLSTIDTINKTIGFIHTDSNINYNILISNVIPYGNEPPILLFKSFIVYNRQKINFSWDENQIGKPVSFSVVNTNPYISISGMNSYIIPEIKKNEVKPNLWDKIKITANKHGDKILFFMVGFAAATIIK